MKINEVTIKQLDEGPLDFAKQVGAGVKGLAQGGLQGAKAGYQAKGAALAQSDKIKTVANQALQKWAAYNQNVKMSTGADATPEQAVAWLAQFMGQQPRTPKPAGSSPAQIQQWLQKEIAGYMAQKELSQANTTPIAPQASAAPTTQQAQPQATQQPAVDQLASGLPDISNLNREELLQLRQQLQVA